MTTAKNNPFATSRVLQVRYTPQGCSWDDLLERLESMQYRGAIVGACGTGKTTLIEDMHQRLRQQGLSCRSIFVTIDVKVPFKKIRQTLNTETFDVLLIDGADHLNKLVWRWIKGATKRRNIGLVVTSHTPGMLPTLIECSTSAKLLSDIVTRLTPNTSDPQLDARRIEDVYHKHNGNIRDALRQLYDITAATAGIFRGRDE
jgi:hypothetical protein